MIHSSENQSELNGLYLYYIVNPGRIGKKGYTIEYDFTVTGSTFLSH